MDELEYEFCGQPVMVGTAPPKDAHVLIPRTCQYVALYGKGTLQV